MSVFSLSGYKLFGLGLLSSRTFGNELTNDLDRMIALAIPFFISVC